MDVALHNHERPNMALGGITPKLRLAMAAKLYFSELRILGGLPENRFMKSST